MSTPEQDLPDNTAANAAGTVPDAVARPPRPLWQRLALLPLHVLAWLLRWGARAVWTLVVHVLIVLLVILAWVSLSSQAPGWIWTQLSPYVPGLEISGISGRFAIGLRVERLHWADDKTDLALTDLRLRWQPAELLQGRLVLSTLQAGRVEARALQPSPEPEPLVMPELDLPLAWFLRDVRIGELHWTPYEGEAVVLNDMALVAEGGGAHVALTTLKLRHALAALEAQGQLDMRGNWPLSLVLVAEADGWPAQRVTVEGDLSALDIRARGPREWPLEVVVRANVLPVAPVFEGGVTWPRWQPPGQDDWRLEAGGLRFSGTTAAGKAELGLAAVPLPGSAMPWPSGWPRKAELAGPLTWKLNEDGAVVDVDWRGRFGAMPWTFRAAFDSARLAATRVQAQLAEARLQAAGWPEARGGLALTLKVPRLERFQSVVAGAVDIDARWQGLEQGQGRIGIDARDLRQGDTALVDRLRVALNGSLASQALQIDARREDITLALGLQGGLDLDGPVWRGRLVSGRVGMPAGDWQLQAPAALSLSATENHIDQQCWTSAPWRLCAEADLLPERWTASLRGESGGDGTLLATLRRDPRQDNPALDADLVLEAVNLARLPMPLPAGLQIRGIASAQARLSGTLEAPLLNGEFGLADAALKMPAYGIDWPTLKFEGRLLGDHVDWRGDIADAAGGTATLTGDARMQPALRVNAKVSGQKLNVAYAPWVKARVSPELTLSVADGRAALRGEVRIPSADITLKQLQSSALKPSSDVRIVRERDGRVPATVESAAGLPLELAVSVVLGDEVKLRGYGLEADLLGHLQLLQRPGEVLSAHGELRLGEDAVYEAYGQRLEITTGRVLFAGPLARPDIRLEAERTVDGVTVGVRVSGRASAPQVELYADEPMAQEEILSLLVLGRSLRNSAEPTAAERQALALGAALKLGGSTGVLERFGSRLGIKDFALGTDGDSDQTQVALSGYVRPDLYLSFGMGVFEPTQSIKLRYQFSKKLSLEAVTSLESAITLFYSWRF